MSTERKKSWLDIRIGRDDFIISLAAATLATVGARAGGMAIRRITTQIEKDRITAEKTGAPPETAKSIIQKEIQRQSIEQSQKEIDLWEQNAFRSLSIPLPTDEVLQEVGQRLYSTLWIMERSENIHFKEAADYLLPLLQSGQTFVDIFKSPSSEDTTRVMTTAANVEDGKLVWIIGIPTDVIFGKNSSELAIDLVHEIEHLQNVRDYDRMLLPLSPEDRLDIHRRRFQDIDEYIVEESRGYKAQAGAYIYHVGLLGRDSTGSEDEELAVTLIQSGRRADSPDWRKYLVENRLQEGIKAREKKKSEQKSDIIPTHD